MRNLVNLMVLFFSLTLLACSGGDDGAVGPQGVQGESGTANVIYSEWITSPFGPPEAASKFFDLVDGAAFDFNNDVVLVYGRRSVGTIANILPYYEVEEQEYYRVNIVSTTRTIRIVAVTTDGVNSFFDEFDEFRYVIIPGGVPAGGDNARGLQPDYQNMSYDEIATLFNIPE